MTYVAPCRPRPLTVPRRATAIAEDPQRDADLLWVPFVESVERVYGWRPEVGAEGAE